MANLLEVVLPMAASVKHRGPDRTGAWVDDTLGIAIAHTRLSIVDLSCAGDQPMISESGRFVLGFNGEIYNFRNLREDLSRSGVSFRGHSDTEVLLAAIERWGLRTAVDRSVGMFACALFDRDENQLHLFRDRIGEKPLFVGVVGKTLLFGSELKALRAFSGWRTEIDRDSLCLFLKYGYVPAPRTIFRNVRKVLPGSICTVALRNNDFVETNTKYWSLGEVVAKSRAALRLAGSTSTLNEFEVLMRRAVSEQMIADVPVGAFLSGGVDSSLISALMQTQSSRPIHTFTIGFHESQYDEAPHAKLVAHHLGTNHTEVYVTPRQALEIVPTLPNVYDEPFGDSSQIPTVLLATIARADVKVSLSGDGGDELFSGYTRYARTAALWKWIRMLPLGLRQYVARLLGSVSTGSWDRIVEPLGGITPAALRGGHPGHKIHRLREIISSPGPEGIYDGFLAHWPKPDDVVLGGRLPQTFLTETTPRNFGDLETWMSYVDTLSYLPDDIMVKVDRASMAVSLETRAPFLDHRIVEFASTLPLGDKTHGGVGKQIVRTLLSKLVPQPLWDRPKMGFGVPVDAWLRGPLREWAETLLDERRLREAGFLDPSVVRGIWVQHLEGSYNWQARLWNVLMFEAWRDTQ